jgi:hypothetical protein
VWKDILFSGFILLSIAACAVYFGPFGPSGQPDPTIIQTAPRPDFFFLWLYALLSFLPPSAETPILLIGPAIGIIVLLALPFVAGEGEKSWRRRPIAVLTILLVAVSLGTLTHLAEHTPWSPVMDAWSSQPIPSQYLQGRTALERHGALVFQAKQCHNCHSLDDKGGQRGPGLDGVALRLTEDQLIRQVIQGGGNMPAYGKTSVLRKQLRWWHSWKHCIRQIKSPRAMLLKQSRSAQTRSRHGRPRYVRAPCPHAGMVTSARHRIPAIGDHGIGLPARLAFSSKCLPKPHPRLAARRIYEWTLFSVGCRRVSSCYPRSSVPHDPHDEAPSVDDGCCSVDSGWGAHVSARLRVTEALR